MSVRAKFRVSSIESYSKDPAGQKKIRLFAVYDDGVEENRRFAKYTPNGSMEITIDNPPAAAFFEIGREIYVDFSEVASEGPAA